MKIIFEWLPCLGVKTVWRYAVR